MTQMKKYKVPEGMLDAAMSEYPSNLSTPWHRNSMRLAFMAAIRWLAENPIIPTEEDILKIAKEVGSMDFSNMTWVHDNVEVIKEWQKVMFLDETGVPESIKDLIWSQELYGGDGEFYKAIPNINKAILEAYNRGRNSK